MCIISQQRPQPHLHNTAGNNHKEHAHKSVVGPCHQVEYNEAGVSGGGGSAPQQSGPSSLATSAKHLLWSMSALWTSSQLTRLAGEYSFRPTQNLSGRQLPDLVHDHILPPAKWDWLDHTDPTSVAFQAPDRLLLLLLLATIIMTVTYVPLPLPRPSRSSHRGYSHSGCWERTVSAYLALVGEVFALLALLYALRATLVLSTTLPTPVRSCINAPSLSDAQSGFAAAATYCNDLMYSGHTATNLVLGCVWSASPTPRWGKVFVALYVAGCMFVSVAVRDHYTADVLVALYVTVPICAWRRGRMVELFDRGGMTRGGLEYHAGITMK